VNLLLGITHSRGFDNRVALRQKKVADSRLDDRIDINDENSIFAQALTCGHKKVLEGFTLGEKSGQVGLRPTSR